jgi:hypothetical protein
MTIQSSILILDDGELENVHRMLLRLGANVVRLVGPEIGESVPAPRDLLISAARSLPKFAQVHRRAGPERHLQDPPRPGDPEGRLSYEGRRSWSRLSTPSSSY